MGQPAARQGDITAHGGVIVSGASTTLIEGQPAARQGDMHQCPMYDGATPHVGGPATMGASSVLIGGQPAARQGDFCTCNGPPDAIIQGASTVLIGSAGSGAATAGRAGGSGVQGATAGAAVAEHGGAESTSRRSHWVEFEFVDVAGRPVSGVAYDVKLPSGETEAGWLQGDGTVRRDQLEAGRATVTLKEVHGAAWDSTTAEVGEEVTVTAQATGVEDGTPATIQVQEVPTAGGPARTVAEIETEVSGEDVEASWTYTYEEGETANASEGQQMPVYVAKVRVEGVPLPAVTGELTVSDNIKIRLVNDDTGEAMEKHPYRIRLSNGNVRTGTTDGDGWIKEEEVPPGGWTFV